MKGKNSIVTELKKKQAYPADAFKAWLKLLEEELPQAFPLNERVDQKVCPGCSKKVSGKEIFNKFGFSYHRCASCDSMFVSPRPTQKEVYNFLKTSKSTRHWYEKMFLPSLESRTLHTINPLALWVGSIIKRFLPEAKTVLDYRPWTYSLAIRDDFPVKGKPFVYEPFFVELGKNVTHLKDLKGTYDVILSLDDVDRESNPSEYFKKLGKMQKKGGLLFITGNTASGFEYLMLGKDSPRLVIPDRLNLLSIEALRVQLEKNGYSILDISTPNKLDVEFVRDKIRENKEIEVPHFFRYLFEQRDETVLQSFQDFLQLSHLTSYCRIAARKIK